MKETLENNIGEFMLRDQILLIFKHFRITAGEQLNDKNFLAVKSDYLKGFTNEEIREESYNMVNEGLFTNEETGKGLTEKGEKAIYGVFDINKSIKEISNLFQIFGTPLNELLPIQSFEAKKREILTPLTIKHLDEVQKECETRGYIEKKNNGLILKKHF
jgi:hypothetical protein